MFRSTIDQASVYPREVVKETLRLNVAAVAFSHNHPSGSPEPSQADRVLTQRLKEALARCAQQEDAAETAQADHFFQEQP